MAVDIDDNILVGTNNTGLYINKNNVWTNYDANDGLLLNSVETINAYQNDEIYFGYTFQSGISKLTGNVLTHIFKDSPFYGGAEAILFDQNNILWIAALDGTIYKYVDGSFITFPEQDIDFHHPQKILFDRKNTLWGASNYGSLKYDGQNWDSVFVDGKLLRSYSLVIDNNDNVWFGSDDDGLFKISESDTVIYNVTNSGLPSNTIFSLAVDSKIIFG